jgi:hypothetical protein
MADRPASNLTFARKSQNGTSADCDESLSNRLNNAACILAGTPRKSAKLMRIARRNDKI